MRGCLNVPVNLKAKKQLVSRMYKVGVNRVMFDSDHLDDIADAITRENIRSLFTANTIKIKPIVGTSRGRAKVKKIQNQFTPHELGCTIHAAFVYNTPGAPKPLKLLVVAGLTVKPTAVSKHKQKLLVA